MPYELELPSTLRKQRWKVKIREQERLEPPHMTIIFKTKTWRFCLREPGFLDRHPPESEVPKDLVDHLVASLDGLRSGWDAMYPENKVGDAQ